MTRVSEGFETFFFHTCFYINFNTLYLSCATAHKSFEILAQTNTPRDMTSDTEGASLERQREFTNR